MNKAKTNEVTRAVAWAGEPSKRVADLGGTFYCKKENGKWSFGRRT